MYAAMFPNVGYISKEFTVEELNFLKNEIDHIKINFDTAEIINHSFTSTVKKEYKIIKSLKQLESLILPMVQIYVDQFDYMISGEPYLETAWVNFQEAGEFFSPHTHTGEFSFVLYLQIPFKIEDELKYLSSKNKPAKTATGFIFYYTDCLGEIKPHYIAVDNSWENKIIFFPGCMMHSVQPFFTSRDYRIAVSGNVKLK